MGFTSFYPVLHKTTWEKKRKRKKTFLEKKEASCYRRSSLGWCPTPLPSSSHGTGCTKYGRLAYPAAPSTQGIRERPLLRHPQGLTLFLHIYFFLVFSIPIPGILRVLENSQWASKSLLLGNIGFCVLCLPSPPPQPALPVDAHRSQ